MDAHTSNALDGAFPIVVPVLWLESLVVSWDTAGRWASTKPINLLLHPAPLTALICFCHSKPFQSLAIAVGSIERGDAELPEIAGFFPGGKV